MDHVSENSRDWLFILSEQTGLTVSALHNRLDRGMPLAKALTSPRREYPVLL